MKIRKPFITWDEWEGAVGGNWSPVGHTHVKADITDTPWVWGDVSKAGSNLTDLATRQHAGLSDAPDDAHHPKLHAASHQLGGGDAIKLDDLATPDNNADLDFSTALHGLVPKGTDVGNFLKDDGSWAALPGVAPHAASHEVGGGDLVSHDSLTDFVADKHIDWTGTTEHLITSGHGIFQTGLYSAEAGSAALKRIWAISRDDFPNHGLFYVNAPVDSIEVRWANVKKGEIRLENGYLLFPRYYMGAHYLSELAAANKVMDSDKVDGEHASAVVTKARVDATLLTIVGSGALAKDHGAAATDMLVNVCYGTGAPPAAGGTTEGTLFVKYTA